MLGGYSFCFITIFTYWVYDSERGVWVLETEIEISCRSVYIGDGDDADDEPGPDEVRLETNQERNDRVLKEIDACINSRVTEIITVCDDRERDVVLPMCLPDGPF